MKPKLEMLKRIVRLGEWSECVRVVRRADRRMMMKLRGGAAGFQIETGRWRGGGGLPDKRECVRNVTVVKWNVG